MDKIIEKKKWTVKKILLIISIALFAGFVLYTIIFADFSSKLNVERDRITISTVRKAPFQEFIPVTGTIEPIQTFYLDLSHGGKVLKKYVQEGAILKVGDPIIKLDNPNLSLQAMNTQSTFLQAESVARQTRLTFEQNLLNKQDQLLKTNLDLLEQERIYKNNKILFEKNLIAANEYETSKNKYETKLKSKELLLEVLKRDSLTFLQILEQNKRNTEMSKRYLELVENQLENLTVTAPISGQLTSLEGEVGQSLATGSRIGQIDKIDSFKVRIEIDEHYITRISVGQIGEYEYNNQKYSLKIKTIYPKVTNGRFCVDMIFLGQEPEGIRRGQSVRLKLQLSNITEELLIDRGSFYNTTGGQWIYVLDEAGTTATKRNITIGRQNINEFEIIDGLNEGEKVIVSSYELYNDVEKLIIKE